MLKYEGPNVLSRYLDQLSKTNLASSEHHQRVLPGLLVQLQGVARWGWCYCIFLPLLIPLPGRGMSRACP